MIYPTSEELYKTFPVATVVIVTSPKSSKLFDALESSIQAVPSYIHVFPVPVTFATSPVWTVRLSRSVLVATTLTLLINKFLSSVDNCPPLNWTYMHYN